MRLALALSLGLLLLVLGTQGGQLGLFLAPWQGGLTQAGGSVGELARMPQLAQENEQLREQVGALAAENARLQAAGQENERLTGLLNLRDQSFRDGLAARVVARDPSGWFTQVAVDRGSEDAVTTETVAVSAEGLVGRVSQFSPHSSRVKLLVAAGSAVPVMLARTGAVGILYGDGGYTCQIKFVSHDVEVKEGEEVLTSGLGQVYPGGLLVGRVIRNYGRTEALFQSLEVRPAVDFGRLRHVLLVTRK